MIKKILNRFFYSICFIYNEILCLNDPHTEFNFFIYNKIEHLNDPPSPKFLNNRFFLNSYNIFK